MSSVINFMKQQTVLVVSGILAVVSCFLVPPSFAYVSYIDTRTLSLLFCLMLVVSGLRSAGTFRVLTEALLRRFHTTQSLSVLLVTLCFFLSMFLTNDVTLITLVPFTLMLFRQLPNTERVLIHTLVLETIAANLGSMLTPIGNPQNLYLYTRYNIPLHTFFTTMAPYAALSLMLCLLLAFLLSGSNQSLRMQAREHTKEKSQLATSNVDAPLTSTPTLTASSSTLHTLHKKTFAFYAVLFLLCLLSVARILDYRILLPVVLVAALTENHRLLRTVDYSLLLTFVFFFIFIGNIGSLPAVSTFLEQAVQGREVLVGILTSQVVSNVPAALLLSHFTGNAEGLLIGVNLGGLGTLIASMASLITYRLYTAQGTQKPESTQPGQVTRPSVIEQTTQHPRKARYLLEFTAMNLLFLSILVALNLLLN